MLIGAWLCSFASPLSAQICVGDCAGLGRVRISDLILAVNIVLGLKPLAECPALGSQLPGIPELIASVNNALCSCHTCPSPPPAPTATATPIPIAVTPTPTATQPEVRESVWQEDSAKLGASSCSRDINDAIRQNFANVNCPYDVTVVGMAVTVVDCDGFTYEGTIDGQGTAKVHTDVFQSVGAGCSVSLSFDLSVKLDRSPSTATYDVGVDFTGCPGVRDCTLRATTRWRRLSGAAAAAERSAARGMAHGVVAALLSP